MPKIIPPGFTETKISRRHRKDCKKHDRCDCPFELYGYVNGVRIREALHTERMDIAVDRQRRREGRMDPAPASAPPPAPVKEPDPDCSIDEAIQKFLAWSKVNSVAESTLVQYGYDLKHFVRFCARNKIRSARQITPPVANDLVLSLADYAATTRAQKFTVSKALITYLQRTGFLSREVMMGRGPRRPKQGAHRPLERIEQRRILAACQTPQERALIMVLLATGLRGVDARQVCFSHFDLKRRLLRMTPQKTRETSGEEVIIPELPVSLCAALSALPRAIDSDYVFPEWIGHHRRGESKKDGDDAGRQRYLRWLSQLMARAKVQATGHDLRCTFAVERLKEGSSMYDVSLMLGHSNVSITQRYYARWENKDALIERLAAVMEKARFDHFEKAS